MMPETQDPAVPVSDAPNRTPEQLARDRIDAMLTAAGWAVQDKSRLNFGAAPGIAVRDYPTDTGPADYVLFVERRPVGIIEAKREEEGHNITAVERQSDDYARARLKWVQNGEPLRFVYEATGVLTRFHDHHDPKPRSRSLFTFFRPETLVEWLAEPQTLRSRLLSIPPLMADSGLRDCQAQAICRLEESFRANRPRALLQMATGAGKTYTAITSIYRLLKYARAKRVLFLVDTRNLGEQAEQEFMAYIPIDENRTFTELYNVQRLTSGYIAPTSQVVIATIQRLYSILKGEPLDDSAELENPAEHALPQSPVPVVYNPALPSEFFDFIIIDECHRSIYNLWRQVLDYFDAFLVGLTATPDQRTYGFFQQNVVSEYSHEEAVADGVNVGYDVYLIETDITQKGGVLKARQMIEKRDRLTRRKRWELQDEDEAYGPRQLDRDVVNPSQIRTVVRAFRDKLPEIFPGRREVPKTLVFAKCDSHADDIIQVVREEFGEGNDFCQKVTYQTTEPKAVLADFRNSYYPRVTVTVDMIATGTDVRPLECLLFMRDVRSRNYFEQMKGRGTRVLDADGLKKVTPSAVTAKTHFVIVDAVGVTLSLKTDTRALERKPGVSLKNLLYSVMMGARDEETLTSLAGRLSRLNLQLDEEERERVRIAADGIPLTTVVHSLLRAVDPDVIEEQARVSAGIPADRSPDPRQLDQAASELARRAAAVFTGEYCQLLEEIRRSHEQSIDGQNLDTLLGSGWAGESEENARRLTADFAACLREFKDTITALQIFFDQPYRRREVTYHMIGELLARLRAERPALAPLRVWQAWAQLDRVQGKSQLSELTALVALIRRVTGLDRTITPYAETVERNFKEWIFRRHAGAGHKFSEEQMAWLRMIRDHIAASVHLERDDIELAPFNAHGGLGRMWQLFGDEMDGVIDEMNEALTA